MTDLPLELAVSDAAAALRSVAAAPLLLDCRTADERAWRSAQEDYRHQGAGNADDEGR